MNEYIFNLETTKIELHFEKSQYDALTDKQKRDLKSAFLWSSRGKCWVSRAKEPNLWRAKQVAEALGFTSEKREGERLSFAEQVEKQTEKAEKRAEQYTAYAEKAAQKAEKLQEPINSMYGDIAFFTQPNISTSAGRAFTKRREAMFDRYEKGFAEYRKSEYFKKRAEDLARSDEKYRNISYLDRRIKECKKEIRAREKNVLRYEDVLNKLENGLENYTYDPKLSSVETVSKWLEDELELIEKAIDKQCYLENCLDAVGGIKFNKDNIQKGDIVRMESFGLCEVVGKGPVNITYRILKTGGILKGTYAEIMDIVKGDEKK